MAISTPLQSPGIFVREIDLTGVVPNVPTSTGAFAGPFNWGPVEKPVLVSNETGLVDVFGTPDSDNTVEWHSAAYFLRYSNELQVIRAVPDTGAVNAHDPDAHDYIAAVLPSTGAPLIKNRDDFDAQKESLAAGVNFTIDSDQYTANHTFLAKYPGELGNSITVHWLAYNDSDTIDASFAAWAYSNRFDAAPGTSSHAADLGAEHDEIHVVVVDNSGDISGTKGGVLETFPFLSVAKGAIGSDGASNYVVDVINNASKYVWMVGFGPAGYAKFDTDAGKPAIAGRDYAIATAAQSITLGGGATGGALDTGDYATAFDTVEDKENILVDFLIAPGMNSRTDHVSVINDLVAIAQGTRKDCVVVASPARSDIINNSDPVSATIVTAASVTQSSYLVMDNNYLKVYDKYNDQYIWIPAASSVAGAMAATDAVAAPWFSPAGPRRGQMLGITSLAYSPNQTQRDTLYKAGVNPIANIPGQGVLLYGDKTKLARPSAFDRINVRRLFLGIERAIAVAARNVMFEFNDEFTRAEFKNIVEPFLREIQGRRGITDFRVVCDETNNTAAVIDRNEFVCSVFIKPARSINFVTLNFVAVRTGVDFEEVVGTV